MEPEDKRAAGPAALQFRLEMVVAVKTQHIRKYSSVALCGSVIPLPHLPAFPLLFAWKSAEPGSALPGRLLPRCMI